MTDQSMIALGLMDAIRATPEDDTPRLILADWMEDNGDPKRAEFIRVQCEIAKLREPDYLTVGGIRIPGDVSRYEDGKCCECKRHVRCKWHALTMRAHEISGECTWFDCLPFPSNSATLPRKLSRFDHARLFTRGFVSAVRCPMAMWTAHGSEIVGEYPITRVEVSDRRPQNYNLDGVNNVYGWIRSDSYIAHSVPDAAWEWMRENRESIKAKLHGSWMDFASHDAAVDGLSKALIATAK